MAKQRKIGTVNCLFCGHPHLSRSPCRNKECSAYRPTLRTFRQMADAQAERNSGPATNTVTESHLMTLEDDDVGFIP